LWAQFEEADSITEKRMRCWQNYHELLLPLESQGLLRRPIVPEPCQHNAHMYYVLLGEATDRPRILDELRSRHINSVFHYSPLHSSPAGKKFGKVSGDLSNTDSCSGRLIRLPLWVGLTEPQQERVVDALRQAILRA
jgi:dTDP-4-amino-4,6-dideoxygalactose transaminase